MKNFNISTNVYFGENSLGILDTIQDKHVLIVCDSFMESSGIVDKVKEHLSACQVDVFSKVVPDPPIEIVSEGIQCLQSCKADVMIAVGGGSSIDAAKAKGADVSADDFEFKNWNPMENYTADLYESR